MKPKKSVASLNTREDGNATKALIIESAGRLIAKHGYAGTTSKMICEEARINTAAVNYHFGSRDGLYMAVLEEVHKHLLSMDYLNTLQASHDNPQAKLEQLLDTFIEAIYSNEKWHARVWAQEIVNPSLFISQILTSEVAPKFMVLSRIFSAASGLSDCDPKLYICMLSVMAPFALIFLANTKIVNKVVPKPDLTTPEMVKELKRVVLTGMLAYVKLTTNESGC